MSGDPKCIKRSGCINPNKCSSAGHCTAITAGAARTAAKQLCPHGYTLANLADGTDSCESCSLISGAPDGLKEYWLHRQDGAYLRHYAADDVDRLVADLRCDGALLVQLTKDVESKNAEIAQLRETLTVANQRYAAAMTRETQLRESLKVANTRHEHYEREWYLRGDEIEKLREQQRDTQQTLERCQGELMALYRRLERINPDDPENLLPESCDGISARNETIRLQDERLARFEWRPIESAPTDGSEVILYHKDWRGKEVMEIRPYCLVGSGGARSYHAYATHWMPLPEVTPTNETIFCIFEDCDQEQLPDSVYCAGHKKQEDEVSS